MSIMSLRDELMRKYGSPLPTGTPVPAVADQPEPERAFVVHAESGRTVITTPLREIAAVNQDFMYLRGRYVEADNPNDNGAMWTTADLQLGEPTVAGGPLNWLHDENKVIGAFIDGQLIDQREAASGIGNHIVTSAAVWRFLFPREADVVEKAALDQNLFLSMECLSREVACVDSPGRPGCGESFSYADYDAGKCCGHLRERSSVRRFVDPWFLGGAVIVPPVRPGWSQASADVVRQATAVSEMAHLAEGNMTESQAQDLAAAVLQWANRE